MSDFSCFCMFYRYWRTFLYPILWLLPSKVFWDDQIFLWWWYGQSFSCVSLILRWVAVYFLLLMSMNLQPIFIEKNSSPFDVDTFKSNFPLNSHLATQMLWQAGLAGFDKALQKICRTLNSCSVSPSTLSFPLAQAALVHKKRLCWQHRCRQCHWENCLWREEGEHTDPNSSQLPSVTSAHARLFLTSLLGYFGCVLYK